MPNVEEVGLGRAGSPTVSNGRSKGEREPRLAKGRKEGGWDLGSPPPLSGRELFVSLPFVSFALVFGVRGGPRGASGSGDGGTRARVPAVGVRGGGGARSCLPLPPAPPRVPPRRLLSSRNL